ncbi:MAG: hypothetical protein IT486_13095 [Gammaproteobacteria bacterium]|nr:hypothetical protein [Gammaproteobacteria bacterium]
MTTQTLSLPALTGVYRPPFVGAFAFAAVLGIVPLMHSMLTLIEHAIPPGYQTLTSLGVGAVAVAMVIFASLRGSEALGTWFGFIAGHLVWSGWIELAFAFNPDYVGMEPLHVDGEPVLTASLMFVQATSGLLFATLPFFVFNRDTRCNAFVWIQRRCGIDVSRSGAAANRNFARITFIEVLYVIWFCYAVSLFLIDPRFVGSHSPITYVAGFGFVAWAFYLLMRLARFTRVLAAVRYSIPTAGIFWISVEFGSEWGLYDEMWSKPTEYAMEMGLVLAAFVVALFLAVIMPKRRQQQPMPE